MDIIEITVIDKDEEIQQLLMDMKKLYIKMNRPCQVDR